MGHIRHTVGGGLAPGALAPTIQGATRTVSRRSCLRRAASRVVMAMGQRTAVRPSLSTSLGQGARPVIVSTALSRVRCPV